MSNWFLIYYTVKNCQYLESYNHDGKWLAVIFHATHQSVKSLSLSSLPIISAGILTVIQGYTNIILHWSCIVENQATPMVSFSVQTAFQSKELVILLKDILYFKFTPTTIFWTMLKIYTL